eukprot:c17026_g1_i1.p4 GENE.c17026_g1_i1~~c17026_g1_i1.p4  ORF type:complete len:101 (-),score=22.25 c17026_g1_i1:143-445(-)
MAGNFGGGAITILGIAGEGAATQVLLADPHYSGPEHLGTMVSTNSLAWIQLTKAFERDKFYNFCLPQGRRQPSAVSHAQTTEEAWEQDFVIEVVGTGFNA